VLGHSGSHAPQLMHSSVIIIAMLFLFLTLFHAKIHQTI
jgi:hypothetical protein